MLRQITPTESSQTSDRDARRLSLNRIHREECGLITWGTLFSVMLLLILFSLVANTSKTVNQKIESQNAADAVAYTPTVWLARGMNAITATNHIIGELNALYALHHAIGGKYLDENDEENDQAELTGLNTGIEIAYALCSDASIPTVSSHKDKTTENPIADVNSTIYKAQRQLKIIIVSAYAAHAVGAKMANYGTLPPIIAAGYVIMAAALVFEWKVYQEWLVLDGVRMLAKLLVEPKKLIPTLINIINIYQQAEVIVHIPLFAYLSGGKVAERHNATGYVRADIPDEIPTSIYGALDEFSKFFPKMPIEKSTTTNEKRSQLIRATWPYVKTWRSGLSDLFIWTCTLSGARGFWREYTSKYCFQASEWIRKDGNYDKELTVENKGGNPAGSGNGEDGKNIQLYVMIDLNEEGDGTHKSKEKWAQDDLTGTRRADEIFCLMGFARTEKPTIASKAFFRQENPHGMACFSQAMLYNANPQQEPASPGGEGAPQPKVGWDTLNWITEEVEWESDTEDQGHDPIVKLNWQAKLTPLTLLKMGKTVPTVMTDEKMRKIMINMGLEHFAMQNH